MSAPLRCSFVALLLLPLSTRASGPTPLFFLFVEIPVAVLSGICLLLCFLAPKVGLVLVSLWTVGLLFVLGWASSVGYMSSGGELVLLAVALSLAGIVIAAKKVNQSKASGP